ncbi:MAG: ABC transporter permease [Clostridiales bacterium]|nr:ABC transporter permease [Clostridiales bacterium]
MKYTAKKLLLAVVTMVIVSFLAFLAFQIIPGDPTTTLLGTDATPERVEALRHQLGLDEPFLLRYGNWVAGFLRGDMGTSYSYSMAVGSMVGGKIPITGLLTAMAFVLIVAVSVPVGLLSARRENSRSSHVLDAVNQVLMAVPPFFTGILLTFVFGLVLKWFTPGTFVSPGEDLGGCIRYLIFPAIAIALPRIAMTVKMLRSSIQSELRRGGYVRTAYSRGDTSRRVLYGHVLRNALVPVVTFLAMTMADIVAGSVVIEQVFAIPGLGQLLLRSISTRDFPVVQAIIVIMAFWVVLVNLLADIVNQQIDPRLRLQ